MHATLNIIMVITLRRMRLAGEVAGMGEMKNLYNILVGKPEGEETTRKIYE
jgi:hypothetical protein